MGLTHTFKFKNAQTIVVVFFGLYTQKSCFSVQRFTIGEFYLDPCSYPLQGLHHTLQRPVECNPAKAEIHDLAFFDRPALDAINDNTTGMLTGSIDTGMSAFLYLYGLYSHCFYSSQLYENHIHAYHRFPFYYKFAT